METQGQLLKGNYGYYRRGTFVGGRENSKVYRGEIISEPPIPCMIKETTDIFHAESERVQAINRFQKEAEAVVRLNHPELVEVIDYFAGGQTYCYCMEAVDGINMESLLNSRKAPFSEREAVDLGILVCRALYYLHIQKPPVVFGNMRPRHIVKTGTGTIKLVEFNLAAHFKPYSKSSPYLPAEYSLAEGKINPRSDLFSLGITLYELCTGAPPDGEFSKLKNISLELGVVIEKSTAPDPAARYRTAREMKDALMDCLKNPQIARGS